MDASYGIKRFTSNILSLHSGKSFMLNVYV